MPAAQGVDGQAAGAADQLRLGEDLGGLQGGQQHCAAPYRRIVSSPERFQNGGTIGRIDRFPPWSRAKRPASSYAVDSSSSSRDGGSKTRCADARGGCCSPTWRSTATGPSAATSWPRRCGRARAPRPPTSRCSRRRSGACARRSARACSRAAASSRCCCPQDAWIDWEVAPELLRAPARARGGDPQQAWDAAREAVEIAERGLLPGLEAPWIDARRAELADLRVEALEALAPAGARLGGAALPEAEQAARAAVEAQPFRESARAALMEVLRARGNVAEALRVYEDLRVLLREELGSSPGAALVALHEQLLRDDPAPRPRHAADARRARRLDARRARPRGRAARLAAARRRPTGEGRAVLIEGPPGIGKTRLLAEFRRRATADGALVLNARAGELEREFPFGVVRQLFEAVVADPERARRRRARRARRVRRRPTTARRAAATPRSPRCTASTG